MDTPVANKYNRNKLPEASWRSTGDRASRGPVPAKVSRRGNSEASKRRGRKKQWKSKNTVRS